MVAPAQTLNTSRVSTVDFVRGLIMVIMALDHTRDYFHDDALAFNPTDLSKTNLGLFATRWITHFCAPTFALLSGTSAYLQLRKKSRKELSYYLLTRGLSLVVFEFLFMHFAYSFSLYFDLVFLSVFWMLGWCMVILSVLVRLADTTILIISLVLIFGHNLLDGITVDPTNPVFIPWTILMRIGGFPLSPSHFIVAPYAIIPWLGIMMFGFWVGKLYQGKYENGMRNRLLVNLGILAVILFIFLRLINIYGDQVPWSHQQTNLLTAMSFMNVSKYPPSLLFSLITVGPILILLALLERIKTDRFQWISVFGRVPLFYFVVHFYILHAAGLIFFMHKTGKSWSEVDLHALPNTFGGLTVEGGYALPWVYVAWVCLILIMYPVCRWYDAVKQTRRYWWLSYL